MTELLDAALAALDAGLCPIPPAEDGSKRPGVRSWKKYQTQRPTEDELRSLYANGRTGIGTLTGAISGNLEMLEFEGLAVRDGIVPQFREAIAAAGLTGVVRRITHGYSESTPSGGMHLVYRCESPVTGNTKLARRKATADELFLNADEKIKTLIETRGEGGYVITAPSSGSVHPTGKPWVLRHGGFATIATITATERDALHAVCRTFDQVPEQATGAPPAAGTGRQVDGDRPGDEFDLSGTQVLEAAGFQHHHDDAKGSHYTRPGKDRRQGSSATVWADNGRTTLFSSNIDAPTEALDDRRNLSAWQLHVFLHHSGDFSAAARAWRKDHPRPARPPNVDPDTGEIQRLHLPDDFYAARPVLAHISQAARARQRSRDAVLHVVLARTAATMPHSVKLPAIVGSPAPLSYFAVTLAPPGSGKGDAAAIGSELVPVDDHVADQLPIGSGEGLAEVLFDFVTEDDNGKPVKVKRQVRHNAFVNIDEGDALAQLGTRNGSTLLSTLRSIWSGKTIGNTNAARENRRIVPAGRYTFGVIVGLQDTKAGPLLDDVDAGTPQRFGWAYAIDPELPDRAPTWPGSLDWHPPDDEALDVIRSRKPEGPTHLLRIHPDMEDEIRALDLARAKGEGPRDPWEAHGVLLRLRVAALLAILDDRLHVHPEDWTLAGTVKAISDNVRAHAQSTVIAEATHKEHQTSTRLANRAADADTAVHHRRIIHCAERIAAKVEGKPEGWTVRSLRQDLRSWREVFEDALTHAKVEGWVIEHTEPGQGTDKRTLVPGERRARPAA